MFRTGDKVTLLCSTFKKGTGPRKGSEGYVSEESPTIYVPEKDLFASIVTIVFTKYGFETKVRKEKKKVINIIPNITKKVYDSEENITAHVKETLSEQDKIDKQTNDISKEIFKYFGPQAIHQAMMVTADHNKSNLLLCPDEEFLAWLDSLLFNEYIRETLRSHSMSKITDGSSPYRGELAAGLTSMAYDKAFKDEHINSTTSLKNRQQTVAFIHQLRFLYSRNILAEVVKMTLSKVNKGRFGSSKKIEVSRIVEHLTYHMFSDLIYKEKVKTLLTAGLGDKDRKDALPTVCNAVETTKNTLISLSRFVEE